MNLELCVRYGQEGPIVNNVAQVSKSDLGLFFDLLLER